ncbi:AzlC family ABC transporter permease [Nocardioides sp. B-3]|uniref:AzlC family ABC transporter permease n=1 Tax=Nocardioides sp. B-3 TaxID=2895565 RepID=UPI00215225DD|nr:AzlC family ABC transporter permease [Nocardioides sp. B-3]UUZ59077.1 AzlC family ABC transporter permease [Nocardioides sp. B-3]
MTAGADDRARTAFRRGLRLGVPFAVVGFLLSLSFGVLAGQAGFSTGRAIVTAMIVFAGSAQFAMLSVITVGGGIPAALTAASLMNARFPGHGRGARPVAPRRSAQAGRPGGRPWSTRRGHSPTGGDGTFDRWLLFGTTLPQYVALDAGLHGRSGLRRRPRATPTASGSTRSTRCSSCPC